MKPDTAPLMTLRLAILSRGPRLYSTRRLVEEADARGCYVEVLDPMMLSITVGNEKPRILNEGWPVEVDAVLPRIGYSITRPRTIAKSTFSSTVTSSSGLPSTAMMSAE